MSTAARITPVHEADEDDLVAYVTAAQADPSRHVTFVGEGEAAVRSDLSAVDGWREQGFVARDATGALCGALVVDVDEELGRCWWLGPWADDDATAAALLAAAAPLVQDLPRREFAPDSRNTWLADLAAGLGYEERQASAILGLDLSTWVDDTDTPHVHVLDEDDRDVVAVLHDRLFPGTHTPGRRLVRDEHTLVLVSGEPPRGYVATQDQDDGSLYIDFLGVDPGSRRRGLARDLLTTTLDRAVERGLDRAYLTVYVTNTGARALYASLGFEEERLVSPWALGLRR